MLIMGAFQVLSGVFETGVAAILPALLLLVFGLAQWWVGSGLRALRPKVRIPAGIISGIGLLAFPIGTVINGYVLYLLFSQKGTTVFSDDYRRLIERTPQIQYKTSPVLWIVLALLLIFIVVMVGMTLGRRY